MGSKRAKMVDQEITLVAPVLERSGIQTDNLRAHTKSDAVVRLNETLPPRQPQIKKKKAKRKFWNGAPRPNPQPDQLLQRTEFHARDALYRQENDNWILDLVTIIQHGNCRNTFHWKLANSEGMLESLENMMIQTYGKLVCIEQCNLLREIANKGSPRHWALLWIIFLSVDRGLQDFVCSNDVRKYCGTDGRYKRPVNRESLAHYLRAVRNAMREYASFGVWDGASVKHAILDWHVYGS